MSTEKLIARAEASLEGVPPAPWHVGQGDMVPFVAGAGFVRADMLGPEKDRVPIAHFFASARQDVPDLIAALRAEREARERAEAALAAGSFYKESDIDALQARAERAEAREGAAWEMVAAAYRDAARLFADDTRVTEPLAGHDVAARILARTPADAQAALDRMRALDAEKLATLERINLDLLGNLRAAEAELAAMKGGA